MENRDIRRAPDPAAIKKVGLLMNIFMGLSMSVFLSFVGKFAGFIQSGKFSGIGYLISVGISFVISLIIGFILPISKIGAAAVRAAKIKPFTIKARLLETLISDAIYTPIMTAAMVAYEYFTLRATAPAEAVEHLPGYFQMFFSSFFACMIAGYILIFIFMPFFLKLSFKMAGIQMSPGGPPAGRPTEEK